MSAAKQAWHHPTGGTLQLLEVAHATAIRTETQTMPLAKRVIPTLLCRGRQLVKGVAFDSWRSVGHAAQAVRIHQARGVDELVLLDIAATAEGRGPDLQLVDELAEACFMPLAVGGGVRSVEDIQKLLRAGADKVVIRTAGPELARRASAVVGRQAIVASIDVRGLGDAVAAASRWEDAGAGEILLTRVEREGTLQGYDLELIRTVSRAVSIPVIAHGGAGTYQHMLEAIDAGADAVAAGAMFIFTEATPRGAAEYLAQHGVEARI